MDDNKNRKDGKGGKEGTKKTDNLISVIVPIYNIEKYVERCVDSIRNQSYTNIEIILVDDGSDDLSGIICDRLAEIDSRIYVVHKENGGLSSARNAGLDAARGKYISLIDGDDYIHPHMYERMLTILLEENADMISCGFRMVEEDAEEKFEYLEREKLPDIICVEGKEILHQLWLRDNETVVQWNKIFRRELFDGCRYPQGRYHEDVYVIHRILNRCKKVVYLNEKLYYYMQRSKSIMHSETRQVISDAIEGYEERIAFFKERKLVYEYQKTIRVLFEYLKWKYDMMTAQNDEGERKWLIDIYRKKYAKYYGEVEYSREERVLFRCPQYFDNYVRFRNFIFKMCSRWMKYGR